jgi:3-methyladenine DNA glycosylase AlkD
MDNIHSVIKSHANPSKAKLLQGFFKTGKGEYGEGDIFLGLTVPVSRTIALQFSDLSFPEIKSLLGSKIHEERLIALLILVHNYEKHPERRESVFDFYIANTKHINNWDLVDLSTPRIIGAYLVDKERDILYEFVNSHNLWERRIAILSTFMFIKNKDFKDSLAISERLLDDTHDLIHKAVGWMLREIGKKDKSVLVSFLKKHYRAMPRTMLRYAIERFPEQERKSYLKGTAK